MAENRELSPKQRRAITALLTGCSVPEAAKKCDSSDRTLYRWLADPDFRAEIQREEDLIIERVTRRLLAGTETAIYTLLNVMRNGSSDGVKRAAANDWLAHFLKIRELYNLEERLQALEEAANVNK